MLRYNPKAHTRAAFVALDQSKAFNIFANEYLFSVVSQFAFPPDFVETIKPLHTDTTSSLTVSGTPPPPPSIRVTRGVRQGCLLSPILFELAIGPFLRRVSSCPVMRGSSLPGQVHVTISAYTDDLGLFVRDSDSFLAFLRIFCEDAAMFGAAVNSGKSPSLRFKDIREDLPGGIPVVTQIMCSGCELTTVA